MRIIFLGTPDFAVPSLRAIAASHHAIVAVVSQPDRKGNRNKLTPTPVKACAEELGLKVLQYERISRDGVSDLRKLDADIMVTCAFGQILSQEVLGLTPYGVINVHASLLPKYRGSSPIQWSVLSGEKVTGVTIMQTAMSVDSGDIISQQIVPIGDDETSGELFDRLSQVGAASIVKTLDSIENGSYTRTVQNHSEATQCRMLKKADGVIDFSKSSIEIKNFVRGMTPWPSAFTYINSEVMKVYKVVVLDSEYPLVTSNIGRIVSANTRDGLIVATGSGAIRLSEVQLANSKRMGDIDFLRGHNFEQGTILGDCNE